MMDLNEFCKRNVEYIASTCGECRQKHDCSCDHKAHEKEIDNKQSEAVMILDHNPADDTESNNDNETNAKKGKEEFEAVTTIGIDPIEISKNVRPDGINAHKVKGFIYYV